MEITYFLRRGTEESSRKEQLDSIRRRSRRWVEGSLDVFSTAQSTSLEGILEEVKDFPKLGAIILRKSQKILKGPKKG